jgi:hypothetical protein
MLALHCYFSSNLRIGAVAIDYDYVLTEMLRHCGGDRAEDDVDPAARGIGNYHFDLPRGPGLSTGIDRGRGDRENKAKPRFVLHGVILVGRDCSNGC